MYDPRMQQAVPDAYYGSPYGGKVIIEFAVCHCHCYVFVTFSNIIVPEGNPAMGGNFYGGVPPGQVFLNDPMANVAMAYGQTLMGQGKQMVDQKVSIILDGIYSIVNDWPYCFTNGLNVFSVYTVRKVCTHFKIEILFCSGHNLCPKKTNASFVSIREFGES